MWVPWTIFLASASVVVLAGTKLSRYGDQIAKETGLGGLWIGVLLMAAATSLPEVLTCVSAAFIQAPDMAVGNLLGSSMANMLVLGIVDLLHRQKSLWRHAAREHTFSAALGVSLTGLAALFILLRIDFVWGSIGIDTVGISVAYIVGMRLVYRQERNRLQKTGSSDDDTIASPDASPATKLSLRRAGLGFAVGALALLIAAPALASSARDIAQITGIGATFVGAAFLAIVTSLPELVTALAAVRLGAFDLAVGNLFGSNAFNMNILLMTDAAYRPGALLTTVSRTHVVAALAAILLTNIGLMGILYRVERRFLHLELDSLLIIIGYGVGLGLIFHLGDSLP